MIELTDEMVHTFIRAYSDADDGSPEVILGSIAERAGLSAVLALYVRQVEGTRGSGLCDCAHSDSAPANPHDGSPMDHHCDCRAVVTAAMLLGAYGETVHAKQCGHGTEFDEFFQRRSPTETNRSGGDV